MGLVTNGLSFCLQAPRTVSCPSCPQTRRAAAPSAVWVSTTFLGTPPSWRTPAGRGSGYELGWRWVHGVGKLAHTCQIIHGVIFCWFHSHFLSSARPLNGGGQNAVPGVRREVHDTEAPVSPCFHFVRAQRFSESPLPLTPRPRSTQ